MLQRLSLLIAALLVLVIAPACGGGGTGGTDGSGATGSVIIGVVSDLRLGVDLQSIHVVMRAGGAVIEDETFSVGTAKPLKLPLELPFADLPGGTAVDVDLEAFRPGDDTNPLVVRRAATEIVAGKKLLHRVVVDSRCIEAPGSSAPTCIEPETCVAGQCADAYVAPENLKPYTPGWGSGTNDVCKPANGGAPTVVVGEGQADYLALQDGEVAQVEAGPQGGHHIWVAIRMKNLAQSGSITSVTGHFPDLGIDVGPFNVIFTFEPDEGGYCKLYGLRFQLDESHDIMTLLGHPLDVKVTVTDPVNDVGEGTRSVVLSSDILQ
ncbi:Hypothetical protein A7982_11390 [Minicystis rosea]|nr:Hypothetical protein A7982_11390 [Minicystis rosea]